MGFPHILSTSTLFTLGPRTPKKISVFFPLKPHFVVDFSMKSSLVIDFPSSKPPLVVFIHIFLYDFPIVPYFSHDTSIFGRLSQEASFPPFATRITRSSHVSRDLATGPPNGGRAVERSGRVGRGTLELYMFPSGHCRLM